MPHRGVTHTQHAKTIDCDPSVDILSVRKTREYIRPLCKDMRSSVQTFLTNVLKGFLDKILKFCL